AFGPDGTVRNAASVAATLGFPTAFRERSLSRVLWSTVQNMPLTPSLKQEAYRRMLRIRRFEEEGTKLYVAGAIPGAFHASIGQEAAIVGACLALDERDMMTGTHRSHGHPIGKGANLPGLMAELMGKDA